MSNRITKIFVGVDGAFGKPCSIAIASDVFTCITQYRTGKVMAKKKLVEMGQNVPSYRLKYLHKSYKEVLYKIYERYPDIEQISMYIELPSVMGMGNTAANLGLASGVIAATSMDFAEKNNISIDVQFIAPTSWRKIALGKGNLKKTEVPRMIQRRYNFEYINEIDSNAKINDDDWDAVGICIAGVLKDRECNTL